MKPEQRRGAPERGSGVISMTMGLFFFFGFLVFATNIMYNLYATSVISGFALDAAHNVAERNGTEAQAQEQFREQVGDDVHFEILRGEDTVRVEVRWETQALLPQLGDARAFGVLDRSFEVRIEEQQ